MVEGIGVLRALLATVDKGSQRKDGGRTDFRHVIFQKLEEFFGCVVPGTSPSSGLVIVPHSAQSDGSPLPQNGLTVIEVFQANGNQVGLFSLLLSLPKIVYDGSLLLVSR